MAAMQAQTIDALAGGNRMIVGLGVSGPQIVEGWYGQPWGKPYWRLRDYIQIMRKIFEREQPVTHDGSEYQLPFTGEGTTGLGKPLDVYFAHKHRPADLVGKWLRSDCQTDRGVVRWLVANALCAWTYESFSPVDRGRFRTS